MLMNQRAKTNKKKTSKFKWSRSSVHLLVVKGGGPYGPNIRSILIRTNFDHFSVKAVSKLHDVNYHVPPYVTIM